MVAAFVLILHAAAALYAFLKYKRESTSEGLLAVGFVAIIFAVGWTISTMLTNPLLNSEVMNAWYNSSTDSEIFALLKKELDRQTVALLFLTTGEAVFYYFFLRPDRKSEKKSTSA